MASDAREVLHSINFEGRRGDELGELRAEGILHGILENLVVQNIGVSGLRGIADGIENRGVELAGHAIEALAPGLLDVPAQAQVHGELGSQAPVILKIESDVTLRVE